VVTEGRVPHDSVTERVGWTRPKLRDSVAADRCTWLVIACYAQLRLVRTSLPTSGCPTNGPARPAA